MSESTLWAIPAFHDNYIWVAQRDSSVVIVDPGDAAAVTSALANKGLELTAILITHHHWDHTNGLAELIAAHDVPVYGPAVDLQRIPQITHGLREGDQIHLPEINLDLDILEVPGHTLDHIAYIGEWNGTPLTFCGDTLFSGGCGRLFEGDAPTMHNSLQKLARLPNDTLVCCTHEYTLANLAFATAVEPGNSALKDYRQQVEALRAEDRPSLPSSIGMEKAINPFLRAHIPEVKAAAGRHGHRPPANDAETFAAIRGWKDNF